MQRQSTASFAQLITFVLKPRLQILPIARCAKILCEECPQGREEQLIRPVGRLRISAATFDFI